jgi:hypothetical protein
MWRTRRTASARDQPERPHCQGVADGFDARSYLLGTNRWFNDWPRRAVRQWQNAGFCNVRLQRVSPHPVYHLRMQYSAGVIGGRQAGEMIRKVVNQSGEIPRGGFFCLADAKGRIEATFVLDL